MKAFPNPFSNSITLDYAFKNSIGKTELKVFNVLGQVVEVQHLDTMEGQLNLGTNWPSGVYFIQAYSDSKPIQYLKVIKQ